MNSDSFNFSCLPFIYKGKKKGTFALFNLLIMQTSIKPSVGLAYGTGKIPPP